MIVVLTGGTRPDRAAPPDWASLRGVSAARIADGIALSEQTSAHTLIISGERIEAGIMANLASASGGPNNGQILLETDSTDTFSSAREVKAMSVVSEEPRIWLVTSAAHMLRAASTYAKQNIAVCPYWSHAMAIARPRIWWLVPHVDNVAKANILVHEVFGLVYYRIRGFI